MGGLERHADVPVIRGDHVTVDQIRDARNGPARNCGIQAIRQGRISREVKVSEMSGPLVIVMSSQRAIPLPLIKAFAPKSGDSR